jgi:hypothetical protein
MVEAIYALGAATKLACAWLLVRGYLRGRSRLLLWSSICFLLLSASSALVFVDLVLLPAVDLFPVRLAVTAAALATLLYGLIWEAC